MNRLLAWASTADSVEELARELATRPAFTAYYREMSRAGRCKLRTRLREAGFDDDQVKVLAPMGESGRPLNSRSRGPFEGLSLPVQGTIADALGLEKFPEAAEEWSDPETAHRAASAIVLHYTNPTSATAALTHLRNGLKALLLPQEVVAATYRPRVTEAHNIRAEVRREGRAAEGLHVPPPFIRIADLRARIQGYLQAGPAWVPDGQAAADFLVAFSARPGEASTLDLGERGGVVGALKKRGAEASYNIVSAIGEEMAQALLAAWKRASAKDRRVAMRDLGALTKTWGVQRRDMRAIGSHLAVRAGVIAGDVSTTVGARDVQQAALRHAPVRRAAVDNYARVVDPLAQLGARLAELSDADLDQVRALVGRL
jgi:hypothetical protein